MWPFTNKNKKRVLGASFVIMSAIGPTVTNAQTNDPETRELAKCYSGVMNAAQNESVFREDYGRIIGQLDSSSFSKERFSEIFDIVNNADNFPEEVILQAIKDLDNWTENIMAGLNVTISQRIIEDRMEEMGFSDEEIQSKMDEIKAADKAVYNAFKRYRDTLAKYCGTSHQ